MKVSWQIAGIRQDAFANHHRRKALGLTGEYDLV